MRIISPIEAENFVDVINNNERGDFGFYPLSKMNSWHGGIHLYSDKPLCAAADGTVVAYRLSSEYIKKTEKNGDIELSDSFILLKHIYETPNKQEIVFYSLYMHLRSWNTYKQSDKYPEFVYDSVFTINTKEDGEGLRIRGEADKSQIIAVIPKECIFKKLSDSSPTWVPPTNEPERYKNYRKVEYLGKTGYSLLDHATCKLIFESLYQVTKTPDDPPIEGTEGIAIRQSGAETPVLEILPFGTQVYFKNESEFKGNKNSNGYYQLDQEKHGNNAGWIYCKGTRIKEERKSIKPTLDTIVKQEKTITVKAGDSLGYAGKWYGNNVFHFEIFTHDVNFMKNPKKDVSSRPVYRVKKETTFKELTYSEPDASLTFPKDAILVMLNGEDAVGKYPYETVRQVALQPIADLWVKRDPVAIFDSKEMCYKLGSTITTGYTTVAENGVPDENSKLTVLAAKGEYLRFLDQKRGDYRLVTAKLKDGQRIAYYAKRNDLGTYKKPEFWTENEVLNVWKMNPEIPQFTNDLSDKLDSDTEFESAEVETKNVFGEVWFGFKLSGSEKRGWVRTTDSNLQIISPFQWEFFFETVKDFTENGYCDCADLIKKIEAVKGNKEDKLLTTEEIKKAVLDPITAKYLRRLVINDATEWSEITDISLTRWKKLYKNYHRSVVKAEWVSFVRQFQWWDHVKPVLDPLLKPNSLWFFHPIAFLEHLGRLIISVQKGCIGSVVEEVNIKLTGFGAGIPWNTFDDLTFNKVASFQSSFMKLKSPTGIIDEATAMAIDEFSTLYNIEFAQLACPCGECGGFGKGINKNIYRENKNDEGYHEYEYPGIHRSLLYSVRALMFFAEALDLKITFTSGYRCSIDNKNRGRPTSNHKGKAIDIAIYEKKGNDWVQGDVTNRQKLANIIRDVFVKQMTAQINWINKNTISLEPEDIAPTWVHADVRMYEPAFLDDKFFVKTQNDLNGQNLLELLVKGD